MTDLTVKGGVTSISPVGVTFSPDITFEELGEVFVTLTQVNRFSAWGIGDCLALAEKKYGDTYSQWLDQTCLSEGRLANLKSLAHRVPLHVRREELSVSHHETIARLPSDEQAAWLDKAVKMGWNRDEFREAVNGRVSRLPSVPNRIIWTAQEIVWAYKKGESIERWVNELETLLSTLK